MFPTASDSTSPGTILPNRISFGKPMTNCISETATRVLVMLLVHKPKKPFKSPATHNLGPDIPFAVLMIFSPIGLVI